MNGYTGYLQEGDLTATEEVMLRHVLAMLCRTYPGYQWSVETRGGLLTVRCGDAVGKYGFHLRLRECDDEKIKSAAGEILERYGLSRRRLNVDEIATAKRNFAGDMVPSL